MGLHLDSAEKNEFNIKTEFRIFTDNQEIIGKPILDGELTYHNSVDIIWFSGSKYFLNLPFDFNQYAQIRNWCQTNCRGPVAFEHKQWVDSDTIYFFFEDDAVAFKLRWL